MRFGFKFCEGLLPLVYGNDADNQNEDSFPVVKCTILSNLAVI